MKLSHVKFGLLMALVSLAAPVALAQANRPNIVVILADDMGYGDLGCYGHPHIKTPNLDRLAAEGMKLTQCYAGAPLCSPSRAAMMTGRVPGRAGILTWIPEDSPVHLRPGELTVGHLLKGAGYATAHVGKWHLNGKFNSPAQPQPNEHGFDYWFSTQNNSLPTHRDPVNFVRNGQPVGKLEGYSSALIVDEAIRWLKGTKKDQPFGLFVWLHAPHVQIATAPEFLKPYAHHAQGAMEYYGNVAQLDHEVGRLLKQLDGMGARENTLVWFTSDNGPAGPGIAPDGTGRGYGSALPLLGRKSTLKEGGIREPGIIRWPGKTKPGQVYNEPVAFVDLLPTVAALTGARLPAGRAFDGVSMLPIFAGKSLERRTPLLWHHGQQAALRQDDWKLIGNPKESRFALFNLKTDPQESVDLAGREPERLKDMTALLQKMYAEVMADGQR